MGHKGPILKPRCIRPRRARTQLLFYSDSLLVPTHLPSTQSMFILALWAGSFHLHYPASPLKHHDYQENISTSSQQMADHTAMIYDLIYPHGITACIYPIQFPVGQPAATLKVHTVWRVILTHLTQCIYFTFFSSVLLLLWHILIYPPFALCHFLQLPLPFTSLTAPTLLPNSWATSHHTQLNLLTVQQWQQLPHNTAA